MTRRTYEKPILVKRDALPLMTATESDKDSDRRFKTDIVQISILRAGIPLYRFRYRWSEAIYVGVMAQDVLPIVPEAVSTDAAGFMRVDYARLGTRFVSLQEWQANGLANAA